MAVGLDIRQGITFPNIPMICRSDGALDYYMYNTTFKYPLWTSPLFIYVCVSVSWLEVLAWNKPTYNTVQRQVPQEPGTDKYPGFGSA